MYQFNELFRNCDINSVHSSFLLTYWLIRTFLVESNFLGPFVRFLLYFRCEALSG